ncbi:MAG: hypothetical protein HY774_21845 [Acidobacteria bacterium]|nr:hypothetical protein [Acidobacteriota bacterium]
MKTILILVFSVFAIASSGYARQTKEIKIGPNIPTVKLCDLIHKSRLYDQQMVRVQGIYRYGVEWSELYCLECLTGGSIWVEFNVSLESRTKKKLIKRVSGNEDLGRTVKVVFVGQYFTGRGYGHMSRHSAELKVYAIEKAEILLNDSPIPADLPPEVLHRAKCQ